MKRSIGLLLAILLIMGAVCASAENGRFEDWKVNWNRMIVDVAISGSEDQVFFGSIDGSELIEIESGEFYAEDTGHIIVIDMGWTWSQVTTVENIVIPAVESYLRSIDQQSRVKFIVANSGSPRETTYMTVTQAFSYVRSNLARQGVTQGKPISTSIDTAVHSAFMQATQDNRDEPAFKSVFVLADPANPNPAVSATSVRRDFKKQGRSFPVIIATVYPDVYVKNNGNTDAVKNIKKNIETYQAFATENDTVLVVMNFDSKTLSTGGIPGMVQKRSFYTLDFSPLHEYIDYSASSHQLLIYSNDSRGNQVENVIGEVKTNVLPTPLPTSVPTASPTSAPTEIPFVVKPGDSTNEAKLVIKELHNLYYLQIDVKDLPGEFDVNCQYAFMEFSRLNGLPPQDNVSREAFDLLISGNAIAAPTATPVPPTAAPEITPAPTELPRIYIGSNSTHALRAIKKLQELYYLDENEKYDTWDSECMLAFQTLCANNGMPDDQEFLDDEMYGWLINSNNIKPKATATPEPLVTPVPKATVPPDGYNLGNTDGEDANFIAQMQTVLQKLGFYTEEMTPGLLDQPTMNAVQQYCQHYGLTIKSPYSVEKTIVLDIINNGPDRTPPTPADPSFSEQFSGFLQQDVFMLGSFGVKMWMLLVLLVVLIFAILLIIILTHKKSEDHTGLSQSVSIPRKPDQPSISFMPGNNNAMSGGDAGDETVPRSRGGDGDMDGDKTVPLGSGLNVTLTITGGPSAGTRRAMISSKNFVIGRYTRNGAELDLALEGDGSISRKHAVLSYKNRQLYITNLSNNGTMVNGQPVDGKGKAPIDSDETMPLGASGSAGAQGFVLKNGDTIEMSDYRIVVTW